MRTRRYDARTCEWMTVSVKAETPNGSIEASGLTFNLGPKLPCCTFSGTMGQCNGVTRNGKRLRSMLAHGLYYIIHCWWTCRPWSAWSLSLSSTKAFCPRFCLAALICRQKNEAEFASKP